MGCCNTWSQHYNSVSRLVLGSAEQSGMKARNVEAYCFRVSSFCSVRGARRPHWRSDTACRRLSLPPIQHHWAISPTLNRPAKCWLRRLMMLTKCNIRQLRPMHTPLPLRMRTALLSATVPLTDPAEQDDQLLQWPACARLRRCTQNQNTIILLQIDCNSAGGVKHCSCDEGSGL